MPYVIESGPDKARHRIIIAHGAGAGITAPFLETMATLLSACGIAVTRFEFDYMSQRRDGGKKRLPPKVDKLCSEYAEMIASVAARRPTGQTVVIGGKSLGGRVASMIAEAQFAAGAIRGLVCFGYPFHAPATPDKLRVAHLETLTCPALIVQGVRDPFGTRAKVEALTLSSAIGFHWIGDGDHDFGPRGASGFTRTGNLVDACRRCCRFHCGPKLTPQQVNPTVRPQIRAFARSPQANLVPTQAKKNRDPMTSAADMCALSSVSDLKAIQDAKAWPFEEARRLIQRLEKLPSGKEKTVLFETGYGPSGLPHIGTFGEVARTTMVRHAFEVLTEGKRKTRLLCFSDDMDGMRKIPDNVPDKAFLEPHLHKPLTVVPNPFGGDYASFGDHNNAMLRRFLDTFGFEYEFASATEYYKAGKFDDVLLRAAARYDEIMGVMLPTLGAERQATYSPFLPISPTSGRVLYVPMKSVDANAGTITFNDEDGREVTLPVTGGNVKLQWKPDFGMRWAALGVDFEMFGKDHQTNAVIYDRICEILDGVAPQHYVYELFLDEQGQKISKSKGNGLTIDQWLTYASPESLSLYMFQKPRSAKKLHFDVIPRAVDEYLQFLTSFPKQDDKQKLDNPVWHIHSGHPPKPELPITFGLLLNLVSVSNAENKDVLWGFVRRYSPGATAEANPILDKLSDYAIRYFNDFVRPTKKYRAPDDVEHGALAALDAALAAIPADAPADVIQNAILDVGRAIPRYQDLAKTSPSGGPGVKLDWFQAIYEVLLGLERGPRLGTFVALYGIAETRTLIANARSGQLSAA